MEALQLRPTRVTVIAGALALATASVLAGATVAGGHRAAAAGAALHCTPGTQAPGGGDRHPGALLPGKPAKLLLCRYGPLASQELQGSRLMRRQDRVRTVVRGFNALPVMPTGTVSCPRDDGSKVVVTAIYAKAAPRVVQVERSGCLAARRGGVVRWDLPDHGRFVHRLERLSR
jgi:hypothetical protein